MGLDQYAYARAKDVVPDDHSPSVEMAYWRKHPNLQGWMERLWVAKGKPMINGDDPPEETEWGTGFNGIELELTTEDIDRLEQDILNDKLPATTGFFFGNPSDEYYREQDLQFVREARANLFLGLKVFYNSSW